MPNRKANNITVHLVYKPDKANNFRIQKAMEILVSEKHILEYFQKLTKKNDRKRNN